jgi:predicted dehydrogenase
MKKFRVGIAGYGIVGKRRRECIEKNPNLELVAVCDRIFEGSGTFEDGIRFFSSYRNMLENSIDILIVCLTNNVAPEVVIAGLEVGAHVFCEKPPGRKVEDILNIIEVERKNPRLKLMYGFNHRHHESVRDALKVIASNELGKVINMRGVYGKSKLVSFNQTDWRTQREIAGGGILLDQGIHMVDLMRLFAGEFIEVNSMVTNSHWNYNVEDNAYALMRTSSGVVAMLHSSATQWRHRFNLDINFEHGSLILGGILSGTKSYGAETLTIVKVDHEKDKGDPREQLTRYNYDPSWEEEINKFVDCIVQDSPILSGSSLDALNTMKLVYRIYYADTSWRKKYLITNPDGKINE